MSRGKLPKRCHSITLQSPGSIDLHKGVAFKVYPSRSKDGWYLQILDPKTGRGIELRMCRSQ